MVTYLETFGAQDTLTIFVNKTEEICMFQQQLLSWLELSPLIDLVLCLLGLQRVGSHVPSEATLIKNAQDFLRVWFPCLIKTAPKVTEASFSFENK